MSQENVLPSGLSKLMPVAGAIGVLGLVGAVVGGMGDTHQFFSSYLFAFLFWVGLGLGSMGLIMIHHLVGGGWGFSIQRLLEAGIKTIPVMFVALLPVLFFGIHDLYHWSHTEAVAKDHILQHKEVWLNSGFFIARSLVYFAIWTLLAMRLTGLSKKQEGGDVDPGSMANKLRSTSGPGIVIYVLTMTFAAFDWAMSLDPHWFSTIYGLIFVVGQVLSTMAFMIIALSLVRDSDSELSKFANVDRVHDLGKLLLAFTMLWAYMALSQYLIIWMANLPEEIGWYTIRGAGGWELLTTIVVLGQFWIPFLLLLSRWPKRNIKQLRLIAGFILLMRFFDIFWLIKPGPEHTELHVHWLDFAAPIGLGGIWIAAFLFFLGRAKLVPNRDPRFQELSHAAH